MTKGLENLSNKIYPGRIIIIGKDPAEENIVVIYAVSGRSPSSQVRKIVIYDNAAWVKPTDEELIKTGEVDLLVYPAVQIRRGIAVSNGKQTSDVYANLSKSNNPVAVLAQALDVWDYEPDAPNYTPRISGCVLGSQEAALSILKRAPDGSSMKYYFRFPLIPGSGKMVATYTGENCDPLPSYYGEPQDIEIQADSPDVMIEKVYAAMGPVAAGQDFRVAAVCIWVSGRNFETIRTAVINRHERKE